MERYTFQDLILSEETDVVYVKFSSAEDLINKLTERNNKLKGWHKRLMHHAMKLEDQNEEMLEAFEHILEYWNRGRNDRAMYDALCEIIKTVEGIIQKVEEGEE